MWRMFPELQAVGADLHLDRAGECTWVAEPGVRPGVGFGWTPLPLPL
jgi:hypothetical protein